MANEPCKIESYQEKSKFCFRPDTPHDSKNLKFKLKPFVTDRERVEKYLKNHKQDYEQYKNVNNYFHKRSNTSDIKGNNNNNNKENDLNLPMKYKPRTDLERIIDEINSNYFQRIDNNLKKEQLKSLGLIITQNSLNNSKAKNNEYSNLKEKLKVNDQTLFYLIKEKQRLEKCPKTQENEEIIATMSTIIRINKEIRRENNITNNNIKENNKKIHSKFLRKNLNNYLANKVLGEYQKKFHFKAVASCYLDCLLKDNNTNDSHRNLPKRNTKEIFNSENIFNTEGNNKINTNNKIKSILKVKSKSDLYNNFFISFNPKNYPKSSIDYLEELIAKENEQKSNNTKAFFIKDKKNNIEEEDIHNENSKKLLEKMNSININGVNYNKYDLPKISGAILRECNVYEKKCEMKKAGDGKTMITRGLSVNNFSSKYGLPK